MRCRVALSGGVVGLRCRVALSGCVVGLRYGYLHGISGDVTCRVGDDCAGEKNNLWLDNVNDEPSSPFIAVECYCRLLYVIMRSHCIRYRKDAQKLITIAYSLACLFFFLRKNGMHCNTILYITYGRTAV